MLAIVAVALVVPQYSAAAVCSGVRVESVARPIAFTSLKSAAYAREPRR